MTKNSRALAALPSQPIELLERLGQRLRAHRVHCKWTVAEMAQRLLCSPSTIRALESGKPGTSIGLLAHALWLFGEIDTLDRVGPAPTGIAAKRRVRRPAMRAAAGVITESERDF